MSGKRSPPFFEVRPSSIQGLGAFASRRIRKGTRIIEYLGERITPAEADRRYDDDNNPEVPVLLFTVNKQVIIDAGVGGNEARYINHSCEPNCEAVMDAGRVYIEALRTIMAGEELTYDYRLEWEEPYDPEEAARYVCRCGAPGCRGTLLAPQRQTRKKSSTQKQPGRSRAG